MFSEERVTVMSSQTAIFLMDVAEFVLWSVLGLLVWKKKLHHRFPAMGAYVALRLASMPALLVLVYGQMYHWLTNFCTAAYFYLYWAVYIASALLLFFVCIEVFRSALAAFPGLQRLGTMVFRWAALVSAIVSLSTLSLARPGVCILTDIAYRLMRSVSIMELCLLAFLCLSLNALRLSIRGMPFGIALGFGLVSANDFVASSLLSRSTSLTSLLQFVYESVILVSLGIWVTYCALPELARRAVLMPANSFILRWNEIASALGHTGTRVAVQETPNEFFLADAEQNAEKILVVNLKSRESVA
jgi:hypothetical protein